MSDTFVRGMGNRIRQSAFVLPFFGVTLFLFFSSAVLGVWDFYTSYLGFSYLPISRIAENPQGWEVALSFVRELVVAGLPQGLLLLSAYVVGVTEGVREFKRFFVFGAAIFIVALVSDTYTGFIFYFRHDLTWNNISGEYMGEAISSLIMAFGIDTMCSEFLSSITFGLLAELWPDAKKAKERLGWKGFFGFSKRDSKTPKREDKKRSNRNNGRTQQNEMPSFLREQMPDPPPPPRHNRNPRQSADYNVFGEELTETRQRGNI